MAEQIETIGSLVIAGRSAEALTIAQPLLTRLDPVRSRDERLKVLSWLGPAFVDVGRFGESLAATNELIELAGGEPSVELASALCLRGVMRVRRRDEQQGLADLRAAAGIAQDPAMGREGLFGTLAVLASSSANVGLYEAAEHYCQWGAALVADGLAVAIAHHAETWAWLHAEWAVTLQHEGDLTGAREHMRRVDELADEIHRAAGLVLDRDQLGHDVMSVDAEALRAVVAAWEGRITDALAVLDGLPAEPHDRPGHNPALAVLLARALSSRALGDADLAMELARRAADLAAGARADRWQAECYRFLRDVAQEAGDPGVASAAAERFEALSDNVNWQRRLRPLQLSPPRTG